MKTSELRSKSEPELERLLLEFREKLRDLRFRVARRELKNVREVRKTRKMIAKILTILKEKKKNI
jgi:large subunit ribosomal protein L29